MLGFWSRDQCLHGNGYDTRYPVNGIIQLSLQAKRHLLSPQKSDFVNKTTPNSLKPYLLNPSHDHREGRCISLSPFYPNSESFVSLLLSSFRSSTHFFLQSLYALAVRSIYQSEINQPYLVTSLRTGSNPDINPYRPDSGSDSE